jgi:hypothetical protein
MFSNSFAHGAELWLLKYHDAEAPFALIDRNRAFLLTPVRKGLQRTDTPASLRPLRLGAKCFCFPRDCGTVSSHPTKSLQRRESSLLVKDEETIIGTARRVA